MVFPDTMLGIVTFDSSSYNGLSTEAIINLQDTDLNISPLIDTAYVYINSTSDPIGFNLQLLETNIQTGIFENKLNFSLLRSDSTKAVLKISDEDKIKAIYYDIQPESIITDSAYWYSEGESIGKILITEVMATPYNDQDTDEFIELYNADTIDINLAGWHFTDGDALDEIISWNPDEFGYIANPSDVVYNSTILHSGNYALILDQEYDEGTKPYNFPLGTLILTTDNTTLGSGLTSTDPITLYIAGGISWIYAIDTYGTPLHGAYPDSIGDDGLDDIPIYCSSGHSAERIDLELGDVEYNWDCSITLNGTAGDINSITPKDYDLGLENFVADPQTLETNRVSRLSVWIHNYGLYPSIIEEIKFFDDIDGDSLFDIDEAIGVSHSYIDPLASGDSLEVKEDWLAITPNWHNLGVVVQFSEDYLEDNNILFNRVYVHSDYLSGIIINEIMANPLGGEYEIPGGRSDEFVELYNLQGMGAIDLADCYLSDGHYNDLIIPWPDTIPLKDTDVITGTSLIPEGTYALILDSDYIDSASVQPYNFPPNTIILTVDDNTLGNGLAVSSDPILLYDPTLSFTIAEYGTPSNEEDNIPFDPSDGYSVERIYPEREDIENNWKSSNYQGGTPGAANSVLPLDNDAKLYAFNFQPILPTLGDTLYLNADIYNNGRNDLNPLSVYFYLSPDTIFTSEEIIDTITLTLTPQDTQTVYSTWIISEFGQYIIGASVSIDDDLSNNTQYKEIYIKGEEISGIIINEIMANPLGLETLIPGGDSDEFIELYNLSGMGSIDLTDWYITESIEGTSDYILPFYELSGDSLNMLLEEGKYALILDPEYILSETYEIPSDVLLLKVDDQTICNNGLSASSDELLLYNKQGGLIDSYGTPSDENDDLPCDPGDGFSMEKINNKSSDLTDNWQKSLIVKGTPGQPNSVSAVDNDLIIIELKTDNEILNANEEFIIIIKIYNAGISNSIANQILLYLDEDNIEDNGNEYIIESISIPSLEPNEEIILNSAPLNLNSGNYILHALLGDDDKPFNNEMTLLLKIGQIPSSIVINEIMFSPNTDLAQTEWIELFNISNEIINLENWRLGDDDTTYIIIDSLYQLSSNDYIIITSDYAKIRNTYSNLDSILIIEPNRWETLNNTNDIIVLEDNLGFTIDRVNYLDDWMGTRKGEKGISLEKCESEADNNSFNWWASVSYELASPLKENSIKGMCGEELTSVYPSPNPFSPDDDGIDDITRFYYKIPWKAQAELQLYDIRGRLLRTWENLLPQGINPYVEWNGRDQDNNLVRIGIYVIFLKSEIDGKIKSVKNSVVVAKPLD